MTDFKTDLEIAREADKKPIIDLAKEKLSISEQDLIPFGHYKAKISSNFLNKVENEKDGKAYIKGLGQLDDQINNKFWFIPVRMSDQDAGVGKINFIDVPNKYKFLLKSNCNYAINYFENRSFFKVLCK